MQRKEGPKSFRDGEGNAFTLHKGAPRGDERLKCSEEGRSWVAKDVRDVRNAKRLSSGKKINQCYFCNVDRGGGVTRIHEHERRCRRAWGKKSFFRMCSVCGHVALPFRHGSHKCTNTGRVGQFTKKAVEHASQLGMKVEEIIKF